MMRIRRYILLKNNLSLKINKKVSLEKCVYLLWKDLQPGSLCKDSKWRQTLSQHMGHIMPKYGWKM